LYSHKRIYFLMNLLYLLKCFLFFYIARNNFRFHKRIIAFEKWGHICLHCCLLTTWHSEDFFVGILLWTLLEVFGRKFGSLKCSLVPKFCPEILGKISQFFLSALIQLKHLVIAKNICFRHSHCLLEKNIKTIIFYI
jgi:hypothetical protein